MKMKLYFKLYLLDNHECRPFLRHVAEVDQINPGWTSKLADSDELVKSVLTPRRNESSENQSEIKLNYKMFVFYWSWR